jgi:hypothetical protein
MMRRGRPEAAAAIWNRSDPGADRKRARSLRRGAIVRGFVAACVGGALYWFSRPIAAYAVWGVASISLFLAIVSPLGIYAALERAIQTLSEWVGTALAWILLAPVFFLFFLPFGLLFRRGARDRMKRRFEPDVETYWKKREDRANLDRPY